MQGVRWWDKQQNVTLLLDMFNEIGRQSCWSMRNSDWICSADTTFVTLVIITIRDRIQRRWIVFETIESHSRWWVTFDTLELRLRLVNRVQNQEIVFKIERSHPRSMNHVWGFSIVSDISESHLRLRNRDQHQEIASEIEEPCPISVNCVQDQGITSEIEESHLRLRNRVGD